jgi:hypothetical protein
MAQTVILRRRGSSQTLEGHANGFFVELVSWQASGKYLASVSYPVSREECDRQNIPQSHRGQIYKSHTVPEICELDEAKRWAAATVREAIGEEVVFADYVEAYCFANEDTLRIWPHVGTDVYRTCAVYEEPTKTVRHARTNVCLIAFPAEGEEPTQFDVDAAARPYAEQVQRAYREYRKDHNQRRSERENRGWLAWLLGEYIKKLPGEVPVNRQSIYA